MVGERSEQQLRRRPEAGGRIERVHRTAVAEDDEPRVGAHHKADPEAHADGDQERNREPVVAPRHDVGERIAEPEAAERDDERHLERVEHHVGVERHGDQPPVILEREPRIGEAQQQHIADRNDKEHEEIERGRRYQQPGRDGRARAAARRLRLRGPRLQLGIGRGSKTGDRSPRHRKRLVCRSSRKLGSMGGKAAPRGRMHVSLPHEVIR